MLALYRALREAAERGIVTHSKCPGCDGQGYLAEVPGGPAVAACHHGCYSGQAVVRLDPATGGPREWLATWLERFARGLRCR
jgi:hypothetical protein